MKARQHNQCQGRGQHQLVGLLLPIYPRSYARKLGMISNVVQCDRHRAENRILTDRTARDVSWLIGVRAVPCVSNKKTTGPLSYPSSEHIADASL